MAERPRRRRSLLADLRPLRESPPFRRLWIGTSISSLGGAMTGFAVVLQIYDLTHSSVAVGALGLAQAIPALVIGLFGGSFADAVDRRRLVLAGFVTASAGLRACYLVDALSFGAALYSVARLPAMPPQGGLGRPGVRAVAEGLHYVRRQPVLAAAFLADIDATVFGMPVALFPALNAERFGGSPQTLGLLNAGLAAGGLLGFALSGPAGRVSRKARAMLFTVSIWGTAVVCFGFARVLWLALLMLVLAGAADTTGVIFRGSIAQAITPDRLRGRVMAVDYAVGNAVPRLGNFEAGAVASLTSPTISAVSGGVATVAGALLIRLAFPALARYRAPVEPAPAAPGAGAPHPAHAEAEGEQQEARP